ncbi:MAG: endonuclease NucS [Candidatus Hodarchaeota archaeon]
MPDYELITNEKTWILQSPTLNQAHTLITAALAQKRLIQIIGQCHVEYKGRARSILTKGERLVIIKRDGAILVHQESGVEPVNWQPPGATIKLTHKANLLLLQATRSKPREKVHVEFSSLAMVSASLIDDAGEFSMYLTEEEMQRILSAHPELIEPGLRTIRRERPVTPGFIDILAHDANGQLVVIELKRRRANSEAVLQLHNYLKSFQTGSATQIRGILVAPSLAKGTQALLEQLGLEFRKIEPQQCAQYLRESKSQKLTDFVKDSLKNPT